jgi:putative transcriptional regulator
MSETLAAGRRRRRRTLSVGTVRDWEQGRALPDGPARVLVKLIERNPDIVLETLQDSVRP